MSKMKSKMRSKPSKATATLTQWLGHFVALAAQIRHIGFAGALLLALLGVVIYGNQNRDELDRHGKGWLCG